MLVMEIVCSFGSIFIACELGERASLAFDEIDQMVGQFNLYYFPPNVMKMLPIFLAMVQKTFRIGVFGSIKCGRESFKNVSSFVKI